MWLILGVRDNVMEEINNLAAISVAVYVNKVRTEQKGHSRRREQICEVIHV